MRIRRGPATLLATAVLLGVPAAPAVADSSWTPPQTLTEDQTTAEVPQVAIADDGTAVAVWRLLDPSAVPGDPTDKSRYRVEYSTRQEGGNFTKPTDHASREATFLSSATTNVAPHIRLKMNKRGDAVVAWEETGANGKQEIHAAYKPFDGNFGPDELVDSTPGDPTDSSNRGYVEPEVGIDGNGEATIIYHKPPAAAFNTEPAGADASSIYVSKTRTAGAAGTWGDGQAFLVPHDAGNETNPIAYTETHASLAVNEDGDRFATFASQEFENGTTHRQVLEQARRHPGDASWSRYTSAYDDDSQPDKEITSTYIRWSPDGGAVVLGWVEGSDPASSVLYSSHRASALPIQSPFNGPGLNGTAFAIDSTEDVVAQWSDGEALRAAYSPGTGGTGHYQTPDGDPVAGNGAGGNVRTRPDLAVDGHDAMLAVYRQKETSGDEQVFAALRPPGGTTNFDGTMKAKRADDTTDTGAPIAISEVGDLEQDDPGAGGKKGTGPKVAMNTDGEAVAAWSQKNLATGDIVVNVALFVPEGHPLPPPPPPPPKAENPNPIQLARPLAHDAAVVLIANLPGQVDKLQWSFGTPDEPPVEGDGDSQRSVRLRIPTDTFKATLRVEGPDGVHTYSRAFANANPSITHDSLTVQHSLQQEGTPPVFAVGDKDALTGKSDQCSPGSVWSGQQKLTGCFKPIENLVDIPGLESGAVHELADQLHVDETKKELMDKATQLTDGYVAQGKALINDQFPVDPKQIDPRHPANLVSIPQAKALVSAKAELPIGTATYDPKNGFNLKVDPKKIKIPLGELPKPPKLPSLGGLEIVGDWHVDLEKKEATIHASLKMPKEVTKAGIRFDNGIDLKATPTEVIVEHAEIGPIEANVGALQVKALKLTYDRALDQWDGQAQACALVAACLNMAPPDGHITVSHGNVTFAGAAIRFPPPGIELFPGIDLSKIGFGVGFDPTRITGSAQISAIRLIGIDGRLVMAFPSEGTPFILRRDEVGPDFGPDLYGKNYTRPTFGLAGGMSFMIPETDEALEFAHGYLLYEYPGFVALGGGGDLDLLGIIQLHGALSANMDIPAKRFNVHGDISECFFESSDLCGHGVANVSHGPNKEGGAGGCIGIGPVNIGGGVQWARVTDPFIWPLDGCKWSRFAIDVSPSAAHAAAASTKYTMGVRQGQPSPVLKLYGKNGAPLVRVSGPGGQHLDGNSKRGLDYTPDGKIRILRFAGTSKVPGDFTEVGLQNADPGTYTVEALPGSPTIIGRAHASDQPDAKVSGKVTGRDRHRVLRYKVGRRSGQKVTFIEVDSSGAEHVLRTTGRAGRGRIRFNSAPGRGVRRIFAQFELDGMPAERKFVTSFNPASPILRRPLRLRVRRRGSRLAVSWSRVRGATRYQVAVRLKPTRRARFKNTRRRHVTFKLARWLSGRVTVRAIDNVRQSRPSASRTFKRTGREPSRFRLLERCIIGKKRIKCGLPGFLDSGDRCLPQRLSVSGRRVGPAFLDLRFRQFYRRYKAVARHGSVTTFCVTGGKKLLVDARRGRIDLVATTDKGHRTRKLGPGKHVSRRSLIGTRRIARGLYIGHRVGRGRVVYVIRGGRVRVLAAVSFQEARHPRVLLRRLRAAGLI